MQYDDEPATTDGFDYDALPTFQEMIDWRDALNSEWSSLDDEQQAEEDLYFQRFDIESPDGHMAVRTGSAPADADAAIDSLVPPDVSVRVRPLRARKKYRDQADKLVRFAKGLLHAWRKQRDFLRLVATDMVVSRVGIVRVMVDDRLWPDRPEDKQEPEQLPIETDEMYAARLAEWREDTQEEAEAWEVQHRRKCPIILQRRDPRTVRWRMSEEGEMLVVVEHYQTTVLEAKATLRPIYGDLVDDACRGLEANTKVWVDDIWMGEYRCLVLNDLPIIEPGYGDYRGIMEHGYGAIPYVVMPFREMTFNELEKKYRGMLSNAAGLYPIESNVLTMQVWMLAINAWRTFLGWTKDNREIAVKPGQYIQIDQRIGEYLTMMNGQPVPPELLQTSAVMDSYIQRNGVAQGPRTAEGTRSAQQVWAIQSMRTLKIESAKDAMTRGICRCLELATMHAETILREPLTLPVPGKTHDGEDMGEVTLKPGDISGYWDGFEVSLGRRLDPGMLEQWKALQGLQANKWMPHRTSIEMSGATDNPQEWLDELVRETVDALPFILEQVGLERIKEFYGEDSIEYQILSQKLQQQQQPANSPMQGNKQQPTNPGKGPQGGGVGDSMAAMMKPKSAKGGGKPSAGPQPQNVRSIG